MEIEEIKNAVIIYNYIREKKAQGHLALFFVKKGYLKETNSPQIEDVAFFYNENNILLHCARVMENQPEIIIKSPWEDENFTPYFAEYKLNEIPSKYGNNIIYYKQMTDKERDKGVEEYFKSKKNKNFYFSRVGAGGDTHAFTILESSFKSMTSEEIQKYFENLLIDTSDFPSY